MNVDYRNLEEQILEGTFRQHLEEELTEGFRQMREKGERLPLPSYYATQIAEIVGRNAPVPLTSEFAFHLYQEILLACERARATVLGEP